MVRRILICSVLIFFLALPFASCEDKTSSKAGSGDKKTGIYAIPAPDFALQDLSGKTHKLSQYRGKVILLNFTTTWCPWCLKDIPNLKKFHERFKGSDFEFISVYLQESRKKVSSFAEKHALPYTILLDTEGKVATSYGVRGVPTKVIVDKDGNITCWMCNDPGSRLEKMLKKK